MANISREERARREAAAASESKEVQDAINQQIETEKKFDSMTAEELIAKGADPNTDVDIRPPVIGVELPPTPEPSPGPTAPPAKEPAKTEAFAVNEKDLKHFAAHKLADEKQRSLDAIEQAVRDNCKIAEDTIRKDPTVTALAGDPGNVELRMAFLRKFGPANVKPPKPAPTPFGIKDEDLMRWTARYEPDNFISTYGKGTSVLVKELMGTIRKAS